MGEPDTALGRVIAALSNVRHSLTGLLSTSKVYEKQEVPPIPDSRAWWRVFDHAPTRDEWFAIEEAIRVTERARLAAAVEQARVGLHEPYYNRGLEDAIAIING
jgi:hypothetical protein